MRYLLVLALVMTVFGETTAQTEEVRKLVTDMIELTAENKLVEWDYEEVVDELINLSFNPINLNNTNQKELEKLIFLSDHQIENILFYTYQNQPLQTIYELQAVEDLDMSTIKNMLPFVYVGSASTKKNRFNPKGQVLTRVQSVVQTSEGYLTPNDSVAAAYNGSKEKVLLRGVVEVTNNLSTGFTLEKDAGEMYFPNYALISDFESAFIEWQKPIKAINKIIVGDYKASFGQGLGMWSDMTFGKTSETAQLRRRPKGIGKYSSANESSYLRGVATELVFGPVYITPFYSLKQVDGSSSDNELGDISAMQTTGYHRTNTELSNRHNTTEQIWGNRIEYRHHLMHLDVGYANLFLSRAIQPSTHQRNLYRFRGDELETLWLAPTFFFHKISLFGEVAMQNDQHMAYYQGLTYYAGSDVVISMAYRNYANGYSAILSNPLAESSIPNGESGVFASLTFKPTSKIEVKANVDFFDYSWMRYEVYAPSKGVEWFCQVNYQLSYASKTYVRYQYSNKQINSSEETVTYELGEQQKEVFRLNYAIKVNDKWSLQSELDFSAYSRLNQKAQHGFLAFQDVVFKANDVFTFSLRYLTFDIEDYNSRIYAYEPDVLYAFTVPAYTGEGTRYVLNTKIAVSRNFSVWFKASHSIYNDRNQISSGYQLTLGNQITDAKVQVLYRF